MRKILSKLFNIIFDLGLVPTQWSIGNIIPIYKQKGNKDDPANYRPITLLCCMGKLFKSIINSRLQFCFLLLLLLFVFFCLFVCFFFFCFFLFCFVLFVFFVFFFVFFYLGVMFSRTGSFLVFVFFFFFFFI